ncbi:MAG: metallophosphoesterase, partial [Terriglobales bacterium]
MTKIPRLPRRPSWGRACLAVLLLAVLVSAASPAGAQQRIVAVGDVHGDFDALLGILRTAGVVDENLQWIGGKTILVQTGDVLDRGPRSRSVMDLLMMLEKQAPKSGGRVMALLGNHEVMNIMGDLRYVTSQEYAAFADAKSEERRRAAYQDYLAWRKGQSDMAPPGPGFEQEWMQSHPQGFVEHRKAFSPEGKYGRWLREHAAVAKVGDILFLHGGVHPKLAGTSVEEMNRRVREEIRAFDADLAQLALQKLAHSSFNLYQTTAAAKGELDRRKATVASREAEATAKGKTYKLPVEDQRYMKWLEGFLSYASGYSVHPDGPLWFRGFAEWPDADGDAKIKTVLEQMGVAHAVVGHTPQRDGSIRSRFGGKVFLVDTGMLSSYYKGGQASALEIQGGKFTAIYRDRRAVLLEPGGGTTPARSSLSERDPSGGALGEEFQQPASAKAPPQPAAATAPGPAHVWIGPDGTPLPFHNDREIMEFLRTAKVTSMKDIGEGITNPQKIMLEKDGVRMNAVFRAVNEDKINASMSGGGSEMFFRDSYIFEPAAYHLSKLLGMDNVPPVVERGLRGNDGSVQIWLEGVMTYTKSRKQKLEPPARIRWSQQIHMMRFFDALVFNTDRNTGNMLIDRGWNLWLIDHTRAFRRQVTLRSSALLIQTDRKLY